VEWELYFCHESVGLTLTGIPNQQPSLVSSSLG